MWPRIRGSPAEDTQDGKLLISTEPNQEPGGEEVGGQRVIDGNLAVLVEGRPDSVRMGQIDWKGISH